MWNSAQRDSLAWEIRKFRTDSKLRAQTEAGRLELDQERLELERHKFKRGEDFGAGSVRHCSVL